jgi:hypothetical protein
MGSAAVTVTALYVTANFVAVPPLCQAVGIANEDASMAIVSLLLDYGAHIDQKSQTKTIDILVVPVGRNVLV